jgi:hypothetical protein
VRLEGLGQLKKIHLIGTRTRDLPACSIVPQPAPPFHNTATTSVPLIRDVLLTSSSVQSEPRPQIESVGRAQQRFLSSNLHLASLSQKTSLYEPIVTYIIDHFSVLKRSGYLRLCPTFHLPQLDHHNVFVA